MTLNKGWELEMTERLKRALMPDRKSIFEEYQMLSRKSFSQLYRIAAKHGFKSGRKPRIDKGQLKNGVSTQQVEFIAGLKYTTSRQVKGQIMPTWRAIQIAEDNGILEKGQVTTETMNRILKERKLSKAHLEVDDSHIGLRSLHPNHVHQFDPSICIQYYLKDGGLGITRMTEMEFNKNKPENYLKIKTRLYRYVLVDHFSGAFFFYYYDAKGENQLNLFDFLQRAWGHKNDERYPFRGVPSILMMDAGSANKSKAVLSMLEHLDVQMPPTMPGNSRTRGSVEGFHNNLEGAFESALRLEPAYDIETLNKWALDFAIWHNSERIHTRTKMARTLCWLKITQSQLRDLPSLEIMQDLFANPAKECTVDGRFFIRFRGKEYNIKHVEGTFRGSKVNAILSPWSWPEIKIEYQGKIYLAKPVELVDGNFTVHDAVIGEEFKATPQTTIQQAKDRIDKVAYGEEGHTKDAIPYEGLQAFGGHADKLENKAFLPKRGHEIEIDREIGQALVPVMELIKHVASSLGEISPELNRRIKAECGSEVKSCDIHDLAEKYERLAQTLETGKNSITRLEAM